MNPVYWLDVITLLAYVSALFLLYYGWNSFLRRDACILWMIFISMALFHSFCHVIHCYGIPRHLVAFQFYIKMLIPLFWGMFFYAFFQGLLAQDLRESEKRYELATISGDIAVWEWDMERNKFFVDPSLGMMLGYGHEELSHKIEDWFALIHPDDAAVLRKQQEALISGAVSQLEQEIRIRRKDGEELWFLARGTTLKDQHTGKLKFFGTVIEISERRRAEQEVRKALNEKEVLLREVHHRVKNNLQIISSLFDLQFEQMQDAKTQEMVARTQERIKAIAFIHDMLYHSRELTAIDLSEYIDKLCLSLFHLSPAKKNNITIRPHIPSYKMDINATIICGMIINELVTNSLKHAFSDQPKGIIEIFFSQDPDGRLCLKIKDDGVGAARDLNDPRNQSLGLQLVRRFAEQLKAEYRFVTNEGTEFEMTFEP